MLRDRILEVPDRWQKEQVTEAISDINVPFIFGKIDVVPQRRGTALVIEQKVEPGKNPKEKLPV